ncbi:hypothetical protein CSOJ01_14139 [Colletotrichum sojae]|uniref:Uncharacterized protein n=1 Tax=Colletotrichum sojae TaxID=2175907 RepID=A0A8H6IQT5_9PEZI|nr:hypothetical protein CSOJ01_14139 [Colletotrichum sojae]
MPRNSSPRSKAKGPLATPPGSSPKGRRKVIILAHEATERESGDGRQFQFRDQRGGREKHVVDSRLLMPLKVRHARKGVNAKGVLVVMYEIVRTGSATPSWILSSSLDETAIDMFWIGVRRRSGMTKAQWLGDDDTEKNEDSEDCIVVRGSAGGFGGGSRSPVAKNLLSRFRASQKRVKKQDQDDDDYVPKGL